MNVFVLRVAVPSPLYRLFDYLSPHTLTAGSRVAISFGRQDLIGVVTDCRPPTTDDNPETLKYINASLDQSPVLPTHLLTLCQWIADYYQHPLGETLAQALPILLRRGEVARRSLVRHYRLSLKGKGLPAGALKSAKRQAEALYYLQQKESLAADDLARIGLSRDAIKALIEKELVESFERLPDLQVTQSDVAPPLNPEQHQAVTAVSASLHTFRCFLLEGITGSGKTEVYLGIIQEALAQGRQALVLVPEIGLTPQTLSRFQRRFGGAIAVLHSGLNDRERLDAWLDAASGRARIVIGTRSAALTPLPDLGIIIIDEEHDSSFKQQEGLRYHARDTLIKRAQLLGIPIVLGSATPALESLINAQFERYQHLRLHQRAGDATPPRIELLDIRHQALEEGLSQPLLDAIRNTLERGEQAMVFINRRGYAPTLLCHDCGWIANCPHCDSRLTLHQQPARLHCHHCDYQQYLPRACPSCHSQALEPQGAGTQRTESALEQHFAHHPVIRIDRDSTQNKDTFQELLKPVLSGEPCILVGTQMLAKGHHFPEVTLVGILDADAGLFSADFRGPERFGQLLTQVAGRAGRAEKTGTVLIQTHLPEHPLLNTLIHRGYAAYARDLLADRERHSLPPFSQLTLIRADDPEQTPPQQLLAALRQFLQNQDIPSLCWGPSLAPMPKRAGRFRWQLHIQARSRKERHQLLKRLIEYLGTLKLARKVRWSIDVDPQDMY